MLGDVVFALWFFVPAGAANMAPVLAARVPLLAHWNAPLDFGATFRGKRVFGSHKTWRGLVSGVAIAILVLWLQQYAVRHMGWFGDAGVEYAALPTFVLGTLFAIGALGGDAVESFFKRRRNIGAGEAWFPYDLIDHIAGAALLTAPFLVFNWWVYLAVIVIWPLINFAISYGGYLLRIKERPI